MKFLILAMLVVSTSAFLNMPGRQQTPQPANNQMAQKPMPDMNLVMQMVRQILMLLLPKLMANPALMASFTGGKPPAPGAGLPANVMDLLSQTPPPGTGPQPGPPKPSKPMPPQMPVAPPAPMGNMNMGRPQIFNPPPRPAVQPFGAGAGGFMPSGDAFKDMRIADLLRDPELGFAADPRVSHMIPPAGSAFGLSLHDRVKDYIQYSIISRRAPGRPLSAKENDLLHLIGDPPKEMMMPGYGARFGGMPGGAMGGSMAGAAMGALNPMMG